MICKKCGGEIKDDAQFFPLCGAEVEDSQVPADPINTVPEEPVGETATVTAVDGVPV